jgi:hypothetical protein
MTSATKVVLALSVGMALAGVRVLDADGPVPAGAVQAAHDHEHGTASPSAGGTHGMNGMHMHQRQAAQQASPDAELTRLVETMNAATGAEKTAAMAALLTRLAQDQAATGTHMQAMQSMMAHCEMMKNSPNGHEHDQH